MNSSQYKLIAAISLYGVLTNPTTAIALPSYTLTGVGGPYSDAMAANDNGQVVGTNAFGDAYIWTSGSGMTSLGLSSSSGTDTLGRSYSIDASRGLDINTIGQVTGYATGNISGYVGVNMPFVWNQNGTVSVFPAYGGGGWQGGEGNAINDNGTVAGDQQRYLSGPGGGLTHEAFIWDGQTSITGLGHTGSTRWSEARDINNAGTVVGFSSVDGSRDEAFAWNPETGMLPLGHQGGFNSAANAINNLSNIVGSQQYYQMNFESRTEAWYWQSPTISFSLGDLANGIFNSEALDINEHGVIIGWGTTDIGREAFYWDSQSGMTRLLDLITDNTAEGWLLLEAAGISNTGIIVGTGINPSGISEGFVLTPTTIPLPPAALLLGSGLFVLINLLRHGSRTASTIA